MCGKAIPASDDTYIHDAELKTDFLKISEVLRLFPKTTPEAQDEMKNLKEAFSHVEKENRIAKTRIDCLQNNIEEMENTMDKKISKRVGDAMKALTQMLKSQGLPVEYQEHKENCTCDECKKQQY